jgi:hypothetical protein
MMSERIISESEKTTMTDAQQILIFKEVQIKADREVDLKFDCTFVIQEFRKSAKKVNCYNCEKLKHITQLF